MWLLHCGIALGIRLPIVFAVAMAVFAILWGVFIFASVMILVVNRNTATRFELTYSQLVIESPSFLCRGLITLPRSHVSHVRLGKQLIFPVLEIVSQFDSSVSVLRSCDVTDIKYLEATLSKYGAGK